MSEAWGTYVHVPWCRRRCPYCAFYVEVDPERAGGTIPWDHFVQSLLAEYRQRRAAMPGPPSTIFLGGGTPSRMPVDVLAKLLAGLEVAAATEVTSEVNPEDVDEAWLQGVVDAGVTRISLGLQTFSRRHARLLNRACSVEQAEQTLALIAGAGLDSWSVDLMFSLPEQTLDELDRDIDAVLASRAPHVALYGLTFEAGTPFERARVMGRMTPGDETMWRAMYDRIVCRLQSDGIERYEVSNFAREGHRSRHNSLYWNDRAYLGLGPSAHGFLPDGSRYSNVRSIDRYLEQDDPTDAAECPTPMQAATDHLLSCLRGAEGVDLDRLQARTGCVVQSSTVDSLVQDRWLHRDGRRIRLTSGAFPVADSVTERLVRSLSVR